MRRPNFPASQLVCVDTFGGNIEHMRDPHFAALIPETEHRFDANVAAFTGRVEKIKGTSADVLPYSALRGGRKQEWPAWVPTQEIRRRLGDIPDYVSPGSHNPMGARALYLYDRSKDTLYRIHGTNQPEYIGHAISSGCIRMTNEDAIDLYNRVRIGTLVVVLEPGAAELDSMAAAGIAVSFAVPNRFLCPGSFATSGRFRTAPANGG
jgi:hypothetical protein